jgi:hypothetical protein
VSEDLFLDHQLLFGGRRRPQSLSETISKELLTQFTKVDQANRSTSPFRAICKNSPGILECRQRLTPLYFSVSLNTTFLRMLSRGAAFVTESVLVAYGTFVEGLLVSQKRRIIASGTWSVLLALSRPHHWLAGHARLIGTPLLKHRAGEDYAEFVEQGYLERLVSRIPWETVQTVDVPFARNSDTRSGEFSAAGLTWSVPLIYFLIADKFLLVPSTDRCLQAFPSLSCPQVHQFSLTATVLSIFR